MSRVLFLHGLESGPQGTKSRALRAAGLEVVAPDLGVSMWRLDRPHSVSRSLLRLPEVHLTAALMALAPFGLGLGALWGAARRRAWIGQALHESRAACTRVAREALEAQRAQGAPIDLLVGSSWGGAIAAELLFEGSWRGPTLLLAPATHKLEEGVGGDGYPPRAHALRMHAERAPLCIVHAPEDEVVPFAPSRALAQGSEVELRELPGGGHRLLEWTERGGLAAAAKELLLRRTDEGARGPSV